MRIARARRRGAGAFARVCATTIEADDDLGLERGSDWTDDLLDMMRLLRPERHEFVNLLDGAGRQPRAPAATLPERPVAVPHREQTRV